MDSNAKQPIQPPINQTAAQRVQSAPPTVPPAAQPPQNKSKFKSLMLLEVGFLEIGFVVLVLLVFFGILNYFNILSLSSLYPSKLGWLPHITKNSQVSTQVTPSPAAQIPTPKQTLSPEALAIQGKQLTNEASLVDISNYIAQITQRFPTPTPLVTTNPEDISTSGILSGYDATYFQIIGPDKTATNYYYDSTTVFNSVGAAGTAPSSNAVGFTQKSSTDILNNANFGKFLSIDYTSTTSGYLKALVVSF